MPSVSTYPWVNSRRHMVREVTTNCIMPLYTHTYILLVVVMASMEADSLLVHLNKCHFLLGKVLVCEVLSAGSEDLQTLLLALLLGGVNVKNRYAAVMGQQRGNLPGEFRTGTFGGRNVTAAGGEEEPRQK